MRILVTGTEGYLGCLLAPTLLAEGHEVTGLDTGYYKAGWLYNGIDQTPHTIAKDIRDVSVDDLRGYEAVVHMAELSNDPIGDLIGNVTFEINHLGSVQLAERAKAAGVSRFVYMSSCSVYGVADGTVDETSPLNPLTSYALCKALVERDLMGMADDGFSPTVLRNATAFGASPRMRFDIVLNNLAGLAWTERELAMTSDGTPWRPLVHALDIARAIRCTLRADRETVHSVVINVGSDENNYTVREIAEAVGREFPGCGVSFGPPTADDRSYRVSFAKIYRVLRDYRSEWDVAAGAAQLHRVFDSIDLDPSTFYGRGHTRLKQIEYLIKTGQVDGQLFWRDR
ncbi:nucleoside-diphosphate-sugar epimerase [Rhodococcus sp. PvR044]|jgi:nucleoside-diphosphate-sugar epimerase|uniref:NAD-dependent epimerase/dehydratase family protein n=1 Tax=unclassified Rhodococcus (in: high G+C Gram-positive bacteria) TaxID=192944 RepID=UPI000BC67E06|nr:MULTISPECIES: SDR family oxidoreductase [unclassified Rhodococcus (in: high G+C Gram-positive bacteria)]PTR42815.1 nucleoside-diphosphate-sugar epimerase [Rhodococcus sp. OK611]SNX91828.1 Nucleoside-diphosphate-sugar epimerase [Rhodococcus sp. OK270]